MHQVPRILRTVRLMCRRGGRSLVQRFSLLHDGCGRCAIRTSIFGGVEQAGAGRNRLGRLLSIGCAHVDDWAHAHARFHAAYAAGSVVHERMRA